MSGYRSLVGRVPQAVGMSLESRESGSCAADRGLTD